MDYELIATLGPSSSSEMIWQEMISVGVTAFRLNTSHLSIQQLDSWLKKLIPILPPTFPVVLDLQGSKWRLGQFAPLQLSQGQMVMLKHAKETDQSNVLPVPHMDFFKAAAVSGKEIVLNDAKIRLWVVDNQDGAIAARVAQGGLISPNKGVTYLCSDYRQETLSKKDQAIVENTQRLEFIRYAISYIKDAAEMAHYRAVLGDSAFLIAKLERQPALEDARKIADQANEIWLCRGDLGAELGIRAMAESVYRFSQTVRTYPEPVLMAGQVLEHMTENITPTRSEICFIHDSLALGYRGFVLSDETAIGQNPIESCRVGALFKAE